MKPDGGVVRLRVDSVWGEPDKWQVDTSPKNDEAPAKRRGAMGWNSSLRATPYGVRG